MIRNANGAPLCHRMTHSGAATTQPDSVSTEQVCRFHAELPEQLQIFAAALMPALPTEKSASNTSLIQEQ